MPFPTAKILHDLFGFGVDGENGFRAAVASRGKAPPPPAHLTGLRRERFQEGVGIGAQFFAMRQAAGIRRREMRNRELRDVGIKTVLSDASTDREEKAHFLDILARGHRRRAVPQTPEADDDEPAGPHLET